MSLFVINRYEDKEWKNESNDTQDHLSLLLKQIGERKRQRETTKIIESQKDSTVKEILNGHSEDNEIPKKKVKKAKVKNKKLESLLNNNVINEESKEAVQNNALESGKNVNDKISKENFTILGSKKRSRTKITKRVLPHWLAHPEIVPADLNSGPDLYTMNTILEPNLIETLKAEGFNKLFPIQAQVLSWLIKCDQDNQAGRWVRDTCICMPTGSGKTLAYALPIIHLLKNNFIRLIRCLVVLPVQELALQVFEVVSKYSNGTSLNVALISGASSFKEEQEKLVQKVENNQYISRVDIVIATPGRLVDHIRKTEGFSLSALRFLVIDEADRITDWLQYIPFPHYKAPSLSINNIRSSWNIPAQKILLSATLSQDPEKLSRLGLFRPILFTSAIIDFKNLDKDLNLDKTSNNLISQYGNPSELCEKIIECSLQHKPLALYQLLIKNVIIEKTLVFTNSSDTAHRLTILLQNLLKERDVNIGELSAQLGSKQREETLDKFAHGSLTILVSSDALARGLDIPEVKLVVSYDMPKHAKVYIHRAGRTARGGVPGTAVSLLQPLQMAVFEKMLNKVGKSIPVIEKENLDIVAESVNYESHLEDLKVSLMKEQEENIRRLKSHKRNIKT